MLFQKETLITSSTPSPRVCKTMTKEEVWKERSNKTLDADCRRENEDWFISLEEGKDFLDMESEIRDKSWRETGKWLHWLTCGLMRRTYESEVPSISISHDLRD